MINVFAFRKDFPPPKWYFFNRGTADVMISRNKKGEKKKL